MAIWKKLIFSGSDAQLNNLYVTNAVTASFFSGNGAAIMGVISASYATSASFATSASWAPSQPAVSSSYAATASISRIFNPSIINGGELGQTNYAWNPTGINDASMVMLSGTGSYATLGGIAGNYKSLTLLNTGSFSVCLSANDSSASAANRLLIREDINLFKDDSVTISYDTINSGWRLIGGTTINNTNTLKQQRSYWQINTSDTITPPDGWSAGSLGGGSQSFTTATATEPAWWIIPTGASSSGVGYLVRAFFRDMFASATTPRIHLLFRCVIKIPTLSTVTETFTIIAGIGRAFAANNMSAAFTYTNAVNSGKFRIETNDGVTVADSGVTVSASTFYRLEIFYRPNNMVSFFINDVKVGELEGVTTGIHGASHILIIKSIGTSNRNVYISSIEQTATRV